MPPRIDDRPRSAFVIDEHGRAVLHVPRMHDVRKLSRHRRGAAEQEIEDVDAMAGRVIERTAARHGRIEQPRPEPVLVVKPVVSRGEAEHRPSDRARGDQFLRPRHLRIFAPIVGHAEELAGLGRGRSHRACLGITEPHRLFAQHVLSGAQRGDR